VLIELQQSCGVASDPEAETEFECCSEAVASTVRTPTTEKQEKLKVKPLVQSKSKATDTTMWNTSDVGASFRLVLF
jgi:hypothetical protein